jgi:hypothetical protein
VTLRRWDTLGWDLAYWTLLYISGGSITTFIFWRVGLFGLFPPWFFVKWAQLDRFNSVILSKIYFLIMMGNYIVAPESDHYDLFRLVSYMGL